MTRVLTETEGQRHQTAINLKVTTMALSFRAEIEREIQRNFLGGGYNVADQAAAFTTALAAVKAVFS